MNPEPTPIAVAVVQYAGRVLIGRRPDHALLAGLWEFPGGKVRAGEPPHEAAARECQEETGLAVRVLGPLAEVTHPYDYGPVRLSFFAAEPTEPERPPGGSFRWVAVEDLDGYEFPPANAAVIRRLLGRGED
jgi:mutator protein MutT